MASGSQMNFSQVLLAGNNPNPQVREKAQNTLKELQNNIPRFLQLLSTELGTEGKPPFARQMAGTQLKNLFESKDPVVKRRKAEQWLQLSPQVREPVKKHLIAALRSKVDPARKSATSVIAHIAQIELPKNQWPNLIDGLVNMATNKDGNVPAPNRQAALECLGFICEDISGDCLKSKTNNILTAVVNAMRKTNEPSTILAGCKALDNCLEFISANMYKKGERNRIMLVVCQACELPNEAIRVEALRVLSGIAHHYYNILGDYMKHIFSITMKAMKKDCEDVAKQAIEFWSTVCDVELELLDEEEDAREQGTQPTARCLHFIKIAIQYLIPPLLETLTKQEEYDDEDEWGVAMAGATCLGLVAEVVGDQVVGHVMPFIKKNIKSADWRFREASTMAFGSILEGPTADMLANSISGALPVIVNQLKDPSPPVRDTAAWALGRICQFHPSSVQPHLGKLLPTLASSMKDQPRVANNCCFAIHNIASSFEQYSNQKSSPMSQYFRPLIKVLLETADRNDADERHLRSSAFETIVCIVANSAKDTTQLVKNLCEVILERLKKTFQMSVNSAQVKERRTEIQGFLCSVLLAIAQKLETEIKPFAHNMMLAFLEIFRSGTSTSSVHEDALMAVGAVANAIGGEFIRYLKPFSGFLLAGLRCVNQTEVCVAAVGAIGDIGRAVKAKMKPLCKDILVLLGEALDSPLLNQNVHPHIISCFGDVALAIGGHFIPFLPRTAQILQRASAVNKKPYTEHTEDFNYYVDNLREAIFDCYTGILHGLQEDRQESKFFPMVPHLEKHINRCWQDEQRTDSTTMAMIGILGDMVCLGPQIRSTLTSQTVQFILNTSNSHKDPQISRLAAWALSEIQSLR